LSHLYRQLTQVADLHATASVTATVQRWGRSEETLVGFWLPGQIVDAIEQPDMIDQRNHLALIGSSEQTASRVVLQALLPQGGQDRGPPAGCAPRAATHGPRTGHITIAEFWDVMADYPCTLPTGSVASTSLDTLHRITGPEPRRPASRPHDTPRRRPETVLDGHSWPG
jgi:hypothetical protein